MDDEHRSAVLKRLRSIAGHVNGIERMVTEDAYCIDVIKQVQAVQAALNKVNDLILEQPSQHVRHRSGARRQQERARARAGRDRGRV